MSARCAFSVGSWVCGYPRDHAIHKPESYLIWRVHPFTHHTNPITECAPCRERDRKLKEETMPDPTPTVLNASPDVLQGVLSAAIAWADSYERINSDMAAGGYPGGVVLSPEGRRLYEAVQRAKGVRTGFDRGAPEGDRTAERPAPSEATDPGVDLARRVAEAVGGDREVTVIIVGEI